jgi:hypothetical protein
MGLLPTLPQSSPQPSQSPEERRAEFDALSTRLRKHNAKEELMDGSEYARVLRRAIDLAESFNQTTAGPRAKPKKIGASKPQPLSLADL